MFILVLFLENLQKYLDTSIVQEPVLKKRKVYDGSIDVSSHQNEKCNRIDHLDFRNIRINNDLNNKNSENDALSTNTQVDDNKVTTQDVYDFID